MNAPVGKINSIAQFEFKWTINYISDFLTKSTGQIIFSPPFCTYSSGKKIDWCMVLSPKGEATDSKNNPSIFLENLNKFEVEVSFRFSLLTKDLKRVKEMIIRSTRFEPGATLGLLKFTEQSFISDKKNNIIVNDEITILCQIIAKNVENQARESLKNVLDGFEKMFLNKKYTDFTVITSNERKLQVHKAILASRSPVFEEMFQNNMIEQSQSSIEIEDVNYEVLVEMFRFIYSNKVQGIEKIICQLLYAANKFRVEALKLLCEETMISNLNSTNAIEYLIEADRNNCSNVQKIQEFIVKHSTDFVRTEEFYSLIKTHPKLTYEIIYAIDNKNPSK